MTLSDQLAEHGIRLRGYGDGEHSAICPKCSHARKKKTDPCLSVKIDLDGAAWKCHHCDWTGGIKDSPEQPAYRPKPKPTSSDFQFQALPAHVVTWFQAERHITPETLAAAGVQWSAQRQAIAFPYRKPGGGIVNAKFRTLDKRFSQIAGGEKLLWLIDKVDPEYGDQIIITEGEMDAMALMEAGLLNVASVPDGAPKQVKTGEIDPAEDKKFSYVPACEEWLKPYARIILAVDGDEPGRALGEELARRLGREKCWTVTFPADCKDANDTLIRHGKEALAEVIGNAKPHPIKSLAEASTFESATLAIYQRGRRRGISTGWPSIDHLYTIAPGQLTVVTGIPNAGKSEWVDALAVNLARAEGWKFALCSFENPPEEHVSKLAEKFTGMPFWDGPRPRMSESELRRAMAWIDNHFHFIRADDEAPTIDWVLETARAAVMRHGIKGLVIDPYNEIEHKRPAGMTETEYVSALLGKVKRFAQNHGVHVWFIAHPAKLFRENGKIPTPTLYDISGSANWANKADVGIVVQAQRDGGKPGPTEIQVKKVRFKWVGRQGAEALAYDIATGIYSDMVLGQRDWTAA